MVQLVDALGRTRDLDPRFKFLDSLTELTKDTVEVMADLEKREGKKVEEAAQRWSTKFEHRKAELDKRIEATNAKPVVTAIIGAVAVTLVSAITSAVGQAAWQMISHRGK